MELRVARVMPGIIPALVLHAKHHATPPLDCRFFADSFPVQRPDPIHAGAISC